MFLWVVYRVYFPCYEYTPVKIHVTVLSTRLRIFLGNVLEGGLGTARAAVVAGPLGALPQPPTPIVDGGAMQSRALSPRRLCSGSSLVPHLQGSGPSACLLSVYVLLSWWPLQVVFPFFR